jgi:hypothetical protein
MAQHAAAERNTQRPFQETLLGMRGGLQTLSVQRMR